MLDIVRKHARSWLIKVALFLIVIVFIFWGGYSYKARQEGHLARVGDHYISIHDYEQFYRQIVDMYRQQLRDSFSEDLLRRLNVRKQALNQLVDRYIIAAAAQGLGLKATTQEIQRKLYEFPAFQTDGKFDSKRYLFILRQNRINPETFEQEVGQDLTFQKTEAFIKRRAVVTEEEILADLRFNYTLFQVAYVFFDPKSFEAEVKVDEKSLESFYQQNQDRYKEAEKRQISYELFTPDSYLPEVRITENQIKDYYEDHGTDYHKEQEVRARHILFRVKDDASEAEIAKAQAEGEKVLMEAKEGKDFTELARKYSQDPTVGENGGDIGFFTRGRMVPEFSEAAFNLKAGEISNLVRSPYGFHIIKVEEVHPEKITLLDDVRGEIESKLKAERTRDIAQQRARSFADSANAQKDVNKTAQTMKLQLTGAGTWVSVGDVLPEVGGVPIQGQNKLFALPEKGISDVLEVPMGFLVAQVDVIQPPQVLPFEKAKDRVEKDYRTDQARILAENRASELLARSRALKNLEAAGAEAKLEVNKSDWFTRIEPDRGLGVLQGETESKVFRLTESDPFPDVPLKTGNRYAVLQLLGRKLPEEALEKERPTITRRLQGEKQNLLWQTWLGEERKKYQIEVFKEL
jgi:peptidyl-prolyl cis-trans isomerase D